MADNDPQGSKTETTRPLATEASRSVIFGVRAERPLSGFVARIGNSQSDLDLIGSEWEGSFPAAVVTYADDAGRDQAVAILKQGQAGHGFGEYKFEVGHHGSPPAALSDMVIEMSRIPGATVEISPKWLAERAREAPVEDATRSITNDAIELSRTGSATMVDRAGGSSLSSDVPYERSEGLGISLARTLSTFERGGKITPEDRAAFEHVAHAATWTRSNDHHEALERYQTGTLDEMPSDASLRLAEDVHRRAKASAEAHPVQGQDEKGASKGGGKPGQIDIAAVAAKIDGDTQIGMNVSGREAVALAFGARSTPDTLSGLNPSIAAAIGEHLSARGGKVHVTEGGSARAASEIARKAFMERPAADGPGAATRRHNLEWDPGGKLERALYAATLAARAVADINREPHLYGKVERGVYAGTPRARAVSDIRREAPMPNDGKKGADRAYLTLTKGEVAKAIALIREGSGVAVAAYPNPMVRAAAGFAGAIEQDQWQVDKAGKASRTGEVKTGREALEALHDSFGEKLYRNVSFSADKVALLSERASADQVGDFAASVKKSEGRRNAAALNREATAKMETKVDVFASRAEIDEARKALDGGTPAKTPTGIVLSRLATAIEQPQWAKGADGKFRETGMVMTGKQALDSLYEGFGKGQHRKVQLDAVKTEYGVDNLGGGMRETFAAVTEISKARNAEFQATRAAAQARPAGRSAGAGR